MEPRTRRLLLGDETRRSIHWLVGGAFLGLLSWIAVGLVGPSGWIIAVVTVVAFQTYDNSGLLVSWAVTFATVAGLLYLVNRAVPVDGSVATVGEAIVSAVIGGTTAAVVFGSIGFLTGMGLRRYAT